MCECAVIGPEYDVELTSHYLFINPFIDFHPREYLILDT